MLTQKGCRLLGDDYDAHGDDDSDDDGDNTGLGPEEDGLVLGDKCGQWGLRCRVGQKGYRGRCHRHRHHRCRSRRRHHIPHICHYHHQNYLNQMNKLAAVTLEGGLHVWDCSTLSQEGKFAQVGVILNLRN